MILYVMRHGEAEPKSSSDAERRLTRRGVEQVTRSLAIASELGATAEGIVTSPLLRARQTAEIAQRLFRVQTVLVNPALEPDSTSLEALQVLRDLDLKEMLLVSHQPLVSELLSTLLDWHEKAFLVRPGTIVKIEVADLSKDRPEGRLLFFLPPQTG